MTRARYWFLIDPMGVVIDLAALAGVPLLARLIALAQALETLRARELPSLPEQLTRH